jgi:nicotinate phosphoribosyltransferase
MIAFAEYVPADVSRIALVDFNNDSITDAVRTMKAMFERYKALVAGGNEIEAQKYILFGVRLDTSGSLRDVNVPPLGDPSLDLGVTPRLVFYMRQALDNAWQQWSLTVAEEALAKQYCQNVRIVVTGGFNPAKIVRFEKLQVPVDIYGVGSSLLLNDKETNTDFTADVVRVQIDGKWHDMAKVGRTANENPELIPVDLADL